MNGILHERDFRGCERKTEITEITTDKSITIDRFSCDNVGLPQANISTESRMRTSQLWFYTFISSSEADCQTGVRGFNNMSV